MENPHLHQIGWAGLICICERVGGVINTGTKKGDWGCNTQKVWGEREMMHERRTTKKELVMMGRIFRVDVFDMHHPNTRHTHTRSYHC